MTTRNVHDLATAALMYALPGCDDMPGPIDLDALDPTAGWNLLVDLDFLCLDGGEDGRPLSAPHHRLLTAVRRDVRQAYAQIVARHAVAAPWLRGIAQDADASARGQRGRQHYDALHELEYWADPGPVDADALALPDVERQRLLAVIRELRRATLQVLARYADLDRLTPESRAQVETLAAT